MVKFEEVVCNVDFIKIVEEKGLILKFVNKIGELDFNIFGIGNNCIIVNWVFEEGSKVGDVKCFNINDVYVVV